MKNKTEMITSIKWICPDCGKDYGYVQGNEEWVFCENNHKRNATKMTPFFKISL